MQNNQTIKLNKDKFRIFEVNPAVKKNGKNNSTTIRLNSISRVGEFINKFIPDLEFDNEFNKEIHSELESNYLGSQEL